MKRILAISIASVLVGIGIDAALTAACRRAASSPPYSLGPIRFVFRPPAFSAGQVDGIRDRWLGAIGPGENAIVMGNHALAGGRTLRIRLGEPTTMKDIASLTVREYGWPCFGFRQVRVYPGPSRKMWTGRAWSRPVPQPGQYWSVRWLGCAVNVLVFAGGFFTLAAGALDRRPPLRRALLALAPAAAALAATLTAAWIRSSVARIALREFILHRPEVLLAVCALIAAGVGVWLARPRRGAALLRRAGGLALLVFAANAAVFCTIAALLSIATGLVSGW